MLPVAAYAVEAWPAHSASFRFAAQARKKRLSTAPQDSVSPRSGSRWPRRASSPSSAMAKLAHDHDAGPDALAPCPRARRQSVSGAPVKRSVLIFAAKLAMRLPGNVGFGPPPAGQAGPFAFLPFAAPPDQDLRAVGRDLQTFKLVAGKIYFFSVLKLYPQVWPDLGEGAVRSPLPEAPPCRHVVPQRTGQIAPTATRREHMQNGFQSLPVIGRRTPPRLWPRKEWPDMLPLCVGEPVC